MLGYSEFRSIIFHILVFSFYGSYEVVVKPCNSKVTSFGFLSSKCQLLEIFLIQESALVIAYKKVWLKFSVYKCKSYLLIELCIY